MGLLNWVKNQLIDIIEWTDDSSNTLVWRFPRAGNEIKSGAQLIVREGQVAIFVHEGQIGDVFKPGRHVLSTQNIPILTSLASWKSSSTRKAPSRNVSAPAGRAYPPSSPPPAPAPRSPRASPRRSSMAAPM